jgi:hypothetical protein
MHVTWLAHLLLLELSTQTIIDEEHKQWSSLLRNHLRPACNPSLSGPNTLSSMLCAQTPQSLPITHDKKHLQHHKLYTPHSVTSILLPS